MILPAGLQIRGSFLRGFLGVLLVEGAVLCTVRFIGRYFRILSKSL